MTLDVDSPRPVRPLKRAFEDIDPDFAPPNKHARLLSPTSFSTTPPIHDRLSEVPRPSSPPSHHTSSDPSYQKPVRPPKRGLEDFGSDCPPASKRHRLLSPTSLPAYDRLAGVPRPSSAPSQPKPVRSLERILDDYDLGCAPTSHRRRLQSPTSLPTPSRIDEWLSNVPRTSSPPSSRPKSAPAHFSGRETLAVPNEPSRQPISLATIHQILQLQGKSLKRSSNASTQSPKPNTSSPIYRSLLLNNSIRMDHTGTRMPEGIREMMDTKILKGRSSPPLPQERVLEIGNKAAALADSAEANVSSLIRTELFPVDRLDIGEGGDTTWFTDALPYEPMYGQPLAAPRPDYHYGYPAGQSSDWTRQQNAVADHPFARPYTQPARGNKFPFLALELKSEATGGTLWHAENQAAGSGSHCVNALRWLLEQASPTQVIPVTDCVAFTSGITHRDVIFFVHYYSEEKGCFYMSYLQRFSTTDPADIQRCHSVVKNILEYGIDSRQAKIKDALKQLFPIPQAWNVSRPAPTTSSTTAASIDEGPRPSKVSRKE